MNTLQLFGRHEINLSTSPKSDLGLLDCSRAAAALQLSGWLTASAELKSIVPEILRPKSRNPNLAPSRIVCKRYPNMNPKDGPSSMNADVATSDHFFEVAYKILSILNSTYWKNPRSDFEAVAITEHLQGLTTQLITTFSESKQCVSTGETICQNMVAICKRMSSNTQTTKAEIDNEISPHTGQLAVGAKRLEERFQAAQTMVDCILTLLPAPSIAESDSNTQVTEQKVEDSYFEGAQAFFGQVAKDLTELKHYLHEMKSIWFHLQQQVTTTAEKAPVEDLEVACKKIEFFYQDYSSRIKSLVDVTFLSDLFPEIEKERDVNDQQLEAILPNFHRSLAREMKTVFERACQCVSILEPWNQATSQHPLANDIIERTQAEFAVFFDLLSTSKDVAQKGIKLIQNISYLCGNLLEPTNGSIQLKKFIQEVIPEAKEAERQSLSTKTKFRVVMVAFTKISKDIPMTVEKIEEERNQAYAAMQRASRSPTIVKAFHKMFRSPVPVTLEGNITLPIPLPFVYLVKRAIEKTKVNKIETRESRLLSAQAALVMLNDVGVFLSEVEQGTANFIKFWTSVNGSLEAVKERIEEMRLYPATWKFRLELAKKQWEETASIYHHYVLQIGCLCQLVPPVRQPRLAAPRAATTL